MPIYLARCRSFSGSPGWRKACSFAPSRAGSGALPLLRQALPRSPCASGHWHSHPRHKPIIPAIPRRRRRPILDILLLGIPLPDIRISRPQPRRRAMPAMVLLELIPAMVLLEPTPAMVIPEPTPIIHTPIGVGLDGAGPAGVGAGPGFLSVGAGEAGGVVADVGIAGSAAASVAGLLMPVFMAEGLAVASTAVVGTVSSRG